MSWNDWDRPKDIARKERRKRSVRNAVKMFNLRNPDYYKQRYMKKHILKIGDKVQTHLYKSVNEKIVVQGEIKAIEKSYGKLTYIITNGVVADFPRRKVKLVKA